MRKLLLLPLFLLGCATVNNTELEAIRILKEQGYSNIKVHNSVKIGCGPGVNAHEWTGVKNGLNYRGRSCCTFDVHAPGCTKSYEIKEN